VVIKIIFFNFKKGFTFKISKLNYNFSIFSFLGYAKHANSYNLLSTLNINGFIV